LINYFKKLIQYFKGNEVANRILKNANWLVSDKVYAMLIGVFVTAIIARYFGPEKYGQFNYALSFTTLFTAVSTLGLETLTVKAILDKDQDEGTILCTSLYLRVIAGIFLTIISFVVIRLLEPADTSLQILVLIMSSVMVFKSLEVIDYWIQAYQRAKILSIIRISAYTITSLLKVLVVILEGNLVHFALIYLIDTVIVGSALFIAYIIKRENKAKWNFNIDYGKNILSQSWYLILSGLMATIYMRMDQIMLGSMLPTKTELGVYSAATQIANMWYFVPMAVITSFAPIIMAKKKDDLNGYLQSVQLLYAIVAWMGLGFGIFILLFSKIIVSILFGSEYLKAASILSVSIWAGTFAVLGSARATWLICEGLQKYSMIYIGAGAVINLVLNYIFIPTWGGYGAAVATLVSQITVSIVVPSFFKETRVSSIMMLKAFNVKWIIRKIMG
jgi:O-antigen/teichoic acid export membrane protein